MRGDLGRKTGAPEYDSAMVVTISEKSAPVLSACSAEIRDLLLPRSPAAADFGWNEVFMVLDDHDLLERFCTA